MTNSQFPILNLFKGVPNTTEKSCMIGNRSSGSFSTYASMIEQKDVNKTETFKCAYTECKSFILLETEELDTNATDHWIVYKH